MVEKDIGALWIKNGAKGQYMTGTIEINGEKLNIVCFTNQNKKETKHPDWRILKAQPRPEETPANALPTRPEEDINPEDIPF